MVIRVELQKQYIISPTLTSDGGRRLLLVLVADASRFVEPAIDDGGVLVVKNAVELEGSRRDGNIGVGLEGDNDGCRLWSQSIRLGYSISVSSRQLDQPGLGAQDPV